ncbi:MAG: TerC/Alx family metal homeostasis membrane protein [Candidatus Jidaibacter sp.]|jgi:tellurite resistance protein TerC|nr:TerC/Alx family metal homeostasis membrane protein [Candidatus Jidaibacter sp.]
MEFPLYLWIGFIVVVTAITILDLRTLHKNPHNISMRESSTMVAIWVLLASIFCTFIYFYAGRVRALEFITGYVVELSLSMDNVFVFFLVFSYLKIPRNLQHRVLFWGILGAIAMRLIMITGGIYIFQNFVWVFYVFGAILIISAIKIFFVDMHQDSFGNNSNGLMQLLTRFGRFSNKLDGEKFITIDKKSGKKVFTPLFVALILVEKTDLVFALDSIPAILAITQSPFVVFTSNIFAILGLRSLYFVVEGLVERFRYLKYGISLILGFVGVKMIASIQGFHMPIEYSLMFILLVLIGSILISWHLTGRANHK